MASTNAPQQAIQYGNPQPDDGAHYPDEDALTLYGALNQSVEAIEAFPAQRTN